MKTILEYLQATKNDFEAPCNGQKQCGKCKIKINNRFVAINAVDERLLSQDELASGYRLACAHQYHHGDDIIYQQVTGVIEDNIYLEKLPDSFIFQKGTGVIVDLGTTTVVLKVIDLSNGKIIKSEAFFNPQIKYGSDVIARIDFDNHDQGYQLSELIISSIFTRITCDDSLKEIIVCGNATMINLFLKEKVRTIGVSPFTVPLLQMIKRPLSYFIDWSNHVDVITVNHISAYVGSDIVMGIYVTDMDKSSSYSLLMDLGTNGEMVIGNKDLLLAASCPAGPAFEGVNIECGGPSMPGAVCQTKIVNGSVSCETIGNQPAACICGSGLISLVANLKRLGIIDQFGNFTNGQKKYYLNDQVYLSIKDIKAFILAKAAIQAGKEMLQKALGHEVDTIYLAGGFGNYLNQEDLVTLNIINESEAIKLKYIKNSALSGTYKLLLSREFERVQAISPATKVIYLEKEPEFNDTWLDAMELG